MKKGIAFGVLSIILAVIIWQFFTPETINSDLIISPSKGDFKIIINTTGEIRAKNSLEIKAPGNVRTVGIYRMKINKLIPEGTIIDSGDFVADLDKSEISNKIKEEQISVDKLESELTQSKLDSSLELSAARNSLENLKFELEEKELLKEQSKYEPPATLRQAELSYRRTLRTFNQEKKNYKTKVKKAIAKISVVYSDYQKAKAKLDRLIDVMEKFTIYAPSKGMLIYERDWNGRAITTGSDINAWNPVVATLPDLSKMESLTFVNEVDIQKIKVGQSVDLTLDANPEKKFTGEVIKVANIGEQLYGTDSKVFRVVVNINERDSTLLPSMTTSNKILIKTIKNALYIPLECLHQTTIKEEKIQFVYTKNNGTINRKEVETADMNENEIVIKNGLSKKDKIFLSVPKDGDNLKLIRLKKSNKTKKIK